MSANLGAPKRGVLVKAQRPTTRRERYVAAYQRLWLAFIFGGDKRVWAKLRTVSHEVAAMAATGGDA